MGKSTVDTPQSSCLVSSRSHISSYEPDPTEGHSTQRQAAVSSLGSRRDVAGGEKDDGGRGSPWHSQTERTHATGGGPRGCTRKNRVRTCHFHVAPDLHQLVVDNSPVFVTWPVAFIPSSWDV
jgi:hypothetical protein